MVMISVVNFEFMWYHCIVAIYTNFPVEYKVNGIKHDFKLLVNLNSVCLPNITDDTVACYVL